MGRAKVEKFWCNYVLIAVLFAWEGDDIDLKVCYFGMNGLNSSIARHMKKKTEGLSRERHKWHCNQDSRLGP